MNRSDIHPSQEPTRKSVGNDLIEEIIVRRSTSSVNGAPKLKSLTEISRHSRQSFPSSRNSVISSQSAQKRRKTLRELRLDFSQ